MFFLFLKRSFKDVILLLKGFVEIIGSGIWVSLLFRGNWYDGFYFFMGGRSSGWFWSIKGYEVLKGNSYFSDILIFFSWIFWGF